MLFMPGIGMVDSGVCSGIPGHLHSLCIVSEEIHISHLVDINYVSRETSSDYD